MHDTLWTSTQAKPPKPLVITDYWQEDRLRLLVQRKEPVQHLVSYQARDEAIKVLGCMFTANNDATKEVEHRIAR
eukprot:10635576-Lingulodinium_polyedra.AAC.1